jgi:hypothetical protein
MIALLIGGYLLIESMDAKDLFLNIEGRNDLDGCLSWTLCSPWRFNSEGQLSR